MPDARESIEARAQGLCESGRPSEAASELIRGFGPEIYGFLAACHVSTPSDADHAFSEFCVAVWRNLPEFRRESSFRTWCYAIARRCSLRVRRDGGRRARRSAELPGDSEAEALAAEVRTETATYLKSQVASRLRQLRQRLDEADQAMLLLRVDRELAWDEVARVLAIDESDGEALKRESARLRKRFELVKKQLYRMARDEGLVGT